MSVRSILRWPDRRLSTECVPLATPDPDLIEDLFDTMYAARGRGLAAPQIGVMVRAFVIDITWKDGVHTPRAFVNPVVREWGNETATADEQCLSIPDLPMPVERATTLVLDWMDKDGKPRSGRFTGIEARCIAHEFDHLNGVVILDHQSAEDRANLEARYAG